MTAHTPITSPADIDFKSALAVIRKLTPKQQDVLGYICINQDQGHHLKTLEVLCRKGLIFPYKTTLNSQGKSVIDRIPIKIVRFGYMLCVHMAWCHWCSEYCDAEL